MDVSKNNVLMDVDMEKLKDWLRTSDGYCIMSPRFFTSEMGFDFDLVERFNRNHGGGEGKHAVQGDPNGVSEFDFIGVVARAVGVENCKTFFGRGKNYRETVANVLHALEATHE